MKRVGIVSRSVELDFRYTHEIPELVAKEVVRAGALPVIIPIQEEVSERYFEELDGLLFLGGQDVLPFHYGEDPDPEAGPYDMKRDAFEIAMIKEAIERKIPILGIGRGMQIINVALGGSLDQNITSKILHYRPSGTKKDPFHRIQIFPGKLQDIFGEELIVNSYHRQGVRSLGKGLSVSARSIDGVVEALEGQGILAVQFQPEFFEHNERFIELFRSFIESL